MIIQTTESSFRSESASFRNQMELGFHQLYAYVMHYYLNMSKEPQACDCQAISIAKADPAVLCSFADLASQLGFDSSEITALKQYSHSTVNTVSSDGFCSLLITAGPGEHID